ncbi:MAG TPA: site-2 protease family protein, partial [Gemmataceae bacterium]
MDQPQNPNHSDPVNPGGPDAAPPPPLTPTAWLMNNAYILVIVAAIIGVIWYNLGLDGVWYVGKVLVGLGFVIFIHELGHFLAAKWCDVHVQTFSIGFGPALPGCSFQHGETTYKIGVLPLGGYVNMIGEGPEADEDENYPRSFKNKTVGQRMLIISAGVIMNVLLGCILFIAVYYYHGVEEAPAVVGQVDPASPLWVKGVRTGALITDLDGIRNPVFKNVQIKVVLSSEGEKLPCTYVVFGPDGAAEDKQTVDLLPRLEENDLNPIVGLSPPVQLRLVPKPEKDTGKLPASRGSAALAARPVLIAPGEILVAATDPDNPDAVTEIKHDLNTGTFDYQEFSKRLRRLEGKKLVIHVLPKEAAEKAKPVERDVPLEGFQFNDTIIGCTKDQTDHGDGYNPFLVEELPHDPRHDSGDSHRDPFVFHDRLRRLAGLPMVIQVRRGDPNNTSLREEPSSGPMPIVNLFVPPAYHVTFGMRMKMGKVAGVRENSPAARAGLQKGDLLEKVVLTDGLGKPLYTAEEIDPERLPYQLARAAADNPGKKEVVLTVRREGEDPGAGPKPIVCEPVEWDDRWDSDQEVPISFSSPLAIPQLGLAYWVHSQIVDIAKGSPAAKAGLKADPNDRDTITQICWKKPSDFKKEPVWSDWLSL